MTKSILEVSDLTKQFKDFMAVDHISFSVKEGEIVGFLGPNGAGKTTTIQMLLGLTIPTHGSIRYFDREFATSREYILSHINFASSYSQMQSRITVRQNMKIYAGLYGIKNPHGRIEEVFDLLEISTMADELFWHLSSGQKTRVILAKALLNHPRLILMDEPTASLDPEIAKKVIEIVRKMQKTEQVTIFYTSHNMQEVEELCDRVIFLDHGKIVAEDTPLGLTKRIGESRLIVTFDAKQADVTAYLKDHPYVYSFPRDHMVEIVVPEVEIPKVLFGLGEKGVWVTQIDIEKPKLEDVFFSIAGGTYERPSY